MEIGKKIEEQRQKILAGDATLANDIAADGTAAIFAGIRTADGEVTAEWEKLMTHFKNDQRELDRLCGRDDDFNKSDWGPMSLAYVAGNSTCTSETTGSTGTVRAMSDEMKQNLDMEF